jgi:hypothetical protein
MYAKIRVSVIGIRFAYSVSRIRSARRHVVFWRTIWCLDGVTWIV